jgi:Transcriptional regulator, AbiEi antitoxin/Protein of unknown function (DUF559)
MRHQRAIPDVGIAALAARQHGVVSVDQLRAMGLDKDKVKRRVRSGRLHRVHRGVYAVGHRSISAEGRCMAAALAIGEGVISHRSAASLWGLLTQRADVVDVTVSGNGGRRSRAGIRLHRSNTLDSTCITRRRGIPITTPARTMSDLRRAVSSEQLRRAKRQADVLGLARGEDHVSDGTRSELEYRFLELCRRHHMPPPAVNCKIAGLLVDFAWLKERLIVETDGYRFHRGRSAFEADRARDLHLRRLGYDVIRLSYRQVLDRPEEVAAVLARFLRQ